MPKAGANCCPAPTGRLSYAADSSPVSVSALVRRACRTAGATRSARVQRAAEAEIAEHAHLAGSAQWRLLSASSNAKLHWKFSCAARAPNRFSLRSYNSAVDDIEDVVLAWVAPVSWIKRGAR